MQDKQSVIRPVRRPRDGWDEQFKLMAEYGDDRLLDAEAAAWQSRTQPNGNGRNMPVRTVDKVRLVSRLGQVDVETQQAVLTMLAEMFAE